MRKRSMRRGGIRHFQNLYFDARRRQHRNQKHHGRKHERTGEIRGQAVALHTLGDKIKLTNCILKSYQDTIFLGPLPADLRERYQSLLPEDELIDLKMRAFGSTPPPSSATWISFSGSANALFTNCKIKSQREGYVAAPSTPEDQKYGLTFLNCVFEGEGEYNTYLAPAWRDYGKACFHRLRLR